MNKKVATKVIDQFLCAEAGETQKAGEFKVKHINRCEYITEISIDRRN